MEPEFPLEFIVFRTPVSLQRENQQARQEWKELVRGASAPKLPQMHFATEERLSVTLYYYPDGQMIGDIDNIIKLTLDAMSQHIYFDDAQIERLVVQKFEQGRLFSFPAPSETLAACMLGQEPALYFRVSTDPFEDF